MAPLFSKNAPGAHFHCFDPRFALSGPIQDLTSPHLASDLAPCALPRAWHLPFRPETECAVFRVVGGKKLFPQLGRQPFQVNQKVGFPTLFPG